MTPRKFLLISGCALASFGTLWAVQRQAQTPFHEYPGVEYQIGEIPIPADAQQRTEWTFARLMFPPGENDGYRGRFDGDWRLGLSLWTQDYPRADRHMSLAVRRLTRIDAREAEQAVNPEDGDDLYNWPWIYAVQVGEWGITPSQAKKLRDYLLRGGFFMADDFHGTEEWNVFKKSMDMVFPDRPIVDIPDNDPIFHTVYNLEDRFQIPGAAHLQTGHKADGYVARWRAIYDDKGRIMVAISFNSDVGDSWEWSDDPRYPEKFSDLGLRIGVNYVVYAMTH
jgi:hypothetical protein